MKDTGFRQGYIEAALKAHEEKIWDAYFSVDVNAKTKYDNNPERLMDCIKKRGPFGMEDFFDQYEGHEIVLTDDISLLKDELGLTFFLNAIAGKDILVHLRVEEDQIDHIGEKLENATKMATEKNMSLLRWRRLENNYLIKLTKRLPDWSRYILRLYEDGNGVIAYCKKEQVITFYFKITGILMDQLLSIITEKIDDIVSRTEEISEDDRFFGCNTHLDYNYQWKYPDADKKLRKGQYYDSTEYCNDENELETVRLLLEVPEIKAKWMKMHQQVEK